MTKKSKAVKIVQAKPQKPKKPTVKQKLETLKATVYEYFKQLRYRQPEQHQIALQATVAQPDGTKRDGVFNVASLIAAVLTAQGLGNEVRLEAEQTSQGGTLYVRFYKPVRVAGQELLS